MEWSSKLFSPLSISTQLSKLVESISHLDCWVYGVLITEPDPNIPGHPARHKIKIVVT